MVVVYGTVCRDRLHRVEHLPEPGGYVDIDEEFDSVGGEAVNTGLALRKWGVETTLCGNSPGTLELATMLESAGLSTDFLPTDEHFEPVCDIYVTPDGQRTMYGRGFVEMEKWGDPSLVPNAAGQWFTTDSNHGKTAVAAVESALKAGMFVYLQDFVDKTAPMGHLWQSSTDWVAKPGDTWANSLWLEDWLGDRGGFAILTDGVAGFVAGGAWPGGACRPVRHYPHFPCPLTIDSTGAGDVFRAGVLFGLTCDMSVADSLRFASAAGSLNCRALGANSAIPSKQDVEALINSHPEVARHYE